MAQTLAQAANKYTLYEHSVQDPLVDVGLMNNHFHRLRGRHPISMKEDFAGSCFLSKHWIESKDDRTALCVDLDEDVLQWGQENHINKGLTAEQQTRIRLIKADVRAPPPPPCPSHPAVPSQFDIIHGGNSSFQCLKKRSDLLDYFRSCLDTLTSDGCLFLEIIGGSSLESVEEFEPVERELPQELAVNGETRFQYIWSQRYFNVVDRNGTCQIVFRFPQDGSEIRPAFEYNWRLYSIPELRELLGEAGFVDSRFIAAKDADCQPEFSAESYREHAFFAQEDHWLGYVIALK